MDTLVSTKADEEEKRLSRRHLLKSALLLSAIGGGMIILGGTARLVAEAAPSSKTAPQTPPPDGPGASAPSPTSALLRPPADASNAASGASVKVKVMYFQMPQNVTSTKEEYFNLQSPAYFRDLLNVVVGEHPLLSPMIPSMMILVDGVLAVPDTPLTDGDEVDLIPAAAGG